MKYIVVELHTGYAVLMDENALFVRAANLGYEVGQTVESPVLEEISEKHGRNIIIYRVLASAAACFALVTGLFVYQRNYAVYSTITISASADEICLRVNRKGEVLTAESINSDTQLLENYDPHGKDKITAAEEIVQKAISMGCINDGDTVSFYIDTPENDYTEYKTEIEEHFRSDRKIKVDVKKDDHSPRNKKLKIKEKNVTTDAAVTEQTRQPAIYQEVIPSENTVQESSAIIANIPKEPSTESIETFPDSDKNKTRNNESLPDSDKNKTQNNESLPDSDKNKTRNNENLPDSDKNKTQNNENLPDSDKNKTRNNESLPDSDKNKTQNNENLQDSNENNHDNGFPEFNWERNENFGNSPDYSENNYDNNENQKSWEKDNEYTQRDNIRNPENNQGKLR